MTILETVTLAQVVTIIAALVLVGGVMFKVWPFVRTFVQTIDALSGLPPLVHDMRESVDEVKELREQVRIIHHEVTPNNGGSMKDEMRRHSLAFARIEAEQMEQRKDIGGIRQEIRDNRARLDRLDDQS